MRNDTPNIIASAAITLPLATLALIARLIARRITKAGYGIDDALSVVGWVCLILEHPCAMTGSNVDSSWVRWRC
jgi:hypothetical protein